MAIILSSVFLMQVILLYWRNRQQVPLKCWYQSKKMHGITFYKTAIFTLITENLTSLVNFYISSLDTHTDMHCSSHE